MKAMLFDLDGTLLNTLEDIASACNQALQDHGFPPHSTEAYRKMVGNGFDILVRRALPQNLAPGDNEIAAITAQARRIYAENLHVKTEPYAGIGKALRELANKNLLLGVYSNKQDELSKLLISRFFPDIDFFTVTGARPGYPLKPNPQVLLELLAQVSVSATDAAYVGDSDVDILTAKNAKVFSIGAGWGFRGMRELGEAGANLVLEKPEQLAQTALPQS